MKRSKIIGLMALVIVLLVIAAGFFAWKAGFISIQMGKTTTKIVAAEPDTKPEKSDKAKVSDKKVEPAKDVKAEDANDKTAKVEEPNDKTAKADDPNDKAAEAEDPNNPMEALNLKDVEMKNIIQKLADWTGKVIIPDGEVMKQKITIYSPRELPRSQALALIYSALRAKGFVAEYTENAIYLKPVTKARLSSVPTISADKPLASIENKNQIAQKIFKLKNYNPVQMGDILLPLVGEYGYVSADENTNNLLVIDTVENLMRFERIISQFDVPESEQAIEEIFEIHDGDPAEIVQLLRKLLAGPSKGRPGRKPGGAGKPGKGKGGKTAESVVIASVKTPIVLIPEPRRKWIIARASAEDMKQIAEWIAKLDQPEELMSEYETISIAYVDPVEVADNLNRALQEMPGTELKRSVIVRPLRQARQIMIFGRAEMREMAKKFIAEIDIPPGQFETKQFHLKHADADAIKENIESLHENINSSVPWWRKRWQSNRSVESVRVVSFPSMQQVTVIASPENMREIEKQITEWDVPLNVEKVKPFIITLHNSDSVKMAELLTKLFTEETSSRNMPWWWGGGDDENKKKIVGALYGQLTFEAVPDTKKIIVISKIPEAYKVIEDLVRELDKQEMAEVPMVKVLKYADTEQVCERLNAIFNVTGTPAAIRRSVQGLSDYSVDEAESQGSNNKNQKEQSTSSGEYTPPWSKGRPKTDEMPLSNVIGRIRFIPDPRSKAIMVLAPPEYLEQISNMIDELDKPGKQVLVKAIIVQVDHENMTSLGVKLSSNPLAFGPIGENAISALTQLAFTENQGTFNLGGVAFQQGASVQFNINTLVDLLVREVDAKILNQPTLWTKDNEEAEFFKGQSVPFLVSTQSSTEGTSQKDSVEYRDVGVTLRIRPNITPDKAVDMTINLKISEVEPVSINGNIVTSLLNTTTHMIVEDGETIMLGGILFKNNSLIEQKIPLFGDLPLVGGLFRHYDTTISNNELLVFITPYVSDTQTSPTTIKELESKKEKLEDVLELLNNTLKERSEY